MKVFRPLLTLLLSLLALPAAWAQVVTTQPSPFRDTDQVTLTFDATQGNAGLATYTGDVYIWTGVITNLSATDSDWKHVVGTSFSSPIAAEKMTSLGNHKYSITFTPRTYYPGLSGSSEVVKKLAMVFRGATGSPEGKGVGGTDILVDVSQDIFNLRFTNPTGNPPYFFPQNTATNVTVATSVAATITLYLNNVQIAQQANATTLTAPVTITQSGNNTLKATASNGTTTVPIEIVVQGRPPVTTAALPAGAKPDGVTYINGGTSAIISLTAPQKQFVYVLGDFNGWQPVTAGFMKRTTDTSPTSVTGAAAATDAATGRWWIQIDGLTAGQEYAYQFLVDGATRIPDPYTEKVLDPNNDQYILTSTYPNLKAYPTGLTTGIVSVLQSNAPAYVWQTTSFQRPNKLDMVVYELLIRDFVAKHDYKTVTDSLDYIKRLGINVLELLPVNEFEGNESWGYNPSFYFAPDKYYGTKNDLKKLVDEAHKRGIAVVFDMVLNHSFGQSPMVQLYFEGGSPATNSPWFNRTAKHPYNVGYDFNHESEYTRYFSKQVMKFWLDEYHIDGYRYDLAGGFSQVEKTEGTYESVFDQSRVDIWKYYYAAQQSFSSGSYAILETFVANTEAKTLADAGLMLWGKMTDNYNEATMGYHDGNKSDLSYGYYKQRGWTEPNLVTFMESHDEQRLMYKNLRFGNSSGSYSVKNLNTALARQEAAGAFFFTVPGARMIWQFGEVGYDKSIFQCPNGTLPNDNGTSEQYGKDQSCKLSNKPVLGDYYDEPARRHLYDVYRSLIALKVQEPAFENPAAFTQNVSGALKTIKLTDPRLSVVIVGNFGVQDATTTPAFPVAGTWYNYLTGSSLTVTDVNMALPLKAGEYAVYTSRRIAVPTGTLLPTRAQQAASLHLTAAPNPTATTAMLRYELPTASAVSITVSNLLGATVRTISANGRQGAGAHEFSLPVAELANGIYLVRLSADGQQQTTRLVVQH